MQGFQISPTAKRGALALGAIAANKITAAVATPLRGLNCTEMYDELNQQIDPESSSTYNAQAGLEARDCNIGLFNRQVSSLRELLDSHWDHSYNNVRCFICNFNGFNDTVSMQRADVLNGRCEEAIAGPNGIQIQGARACRLIQEIGPNNNSITNGTETDEANEGLQGWEIALITLGGIILCIGFVFLVLKTCESSDAEAGDEQEPQAAAVDGAEDGQQVAIENPAYSPTAEAGDGEHSSDIEDDAAAGAEDGGGQHVAIEILADSPTAAAAAAAANLLAETNL